MYPINNVPQGAAELLQAAIRNGWINPQYLGQSSFTTQLPPELERLFRRSVNTGMFGQIPAEEIYNPRADYDYRGYWQAYKNNDPITKQTMDPNDQSLHYVDKWKTPYHQSFSNESMYANPLTAPRWQGIPETYKTVDPRTGQPIFDEHQQMIDRLLTSLLHPAQNAIDALAPFLAGWK